MRKKILVTLWLLAPVVLLAIHYGPGQKSLSRDKAAENIALAQAAEQAENWSGAVDYYGAALAALPAENLEQRFQIRLAQAKARSWTGELPEAKSDLDGLLADALKHNADSSIVREVRANLATLEYYAGWLMRLEGAATGEWMAETDSSRQHFRLLAEQAQQAGHSVAGDFQKNLESVIRLELMDLSELQALPLPKQCKNCSNCSSKCRKQRESNCKAPGKQPQDVREKISEQKSNNAGQSGRQGTGS